MGKRLRALVMSSKNRAAIREFVSSLANGQGVDGRWTADADGQWRRARHRDSCPRQTRFSIDKLTHTMRVERAPFRTTQLLRRTSNVPPRFSLV